MKSILEFPVGPVCDRCGNRTFIIRQIQAGRLATARTLQIFECPKCMRTMNVVVPSESANSPDGRSLEESGRG